jgi:hypothetical protein
MFYSCVIQAAVCLISAPVASCLAALCTMRVVLGYTKGAMLDSAMALEAPFVHLARDDSCVREAVAHVLEIDNISELRHDSGWWKWSMPLRIAVQYGAARFTSPSQHITVCHGYLLSRPKKK